VIAGWASVWEMSPEAVGSDPAKAEALTTERLDYRLQLRLYNLGRGVVLRLPYSQDHSAVILGLEFDPVSGCAQA